MPLWTSYIISNGVPSAVNSVPVAAVGQAVPVLARPFPLLSAAVSSTIRTSQCLKDPETGKLGIFFSWNGLGGAVSIKELTGPALQPPNNASSSSCSLRVGQWVLTINGVPVQNSKHAAQLVRNTPGPTVELTTCEAPTTTTTTQRNNKHLPPFTKLVAAPLWPQTHPGVVFDSTRDRTLVQVSRVFAKGPFGSTNSGVRPGDLVLAVNGTPVSTVQQADAALLQQQQQPYTVLYVVDMTAYRHSVWEELKHSPLLAGWSSSSSDELQMQWLDQEDNSPTTNKFKSSPTRVQVTFRKKLVVDLEFDFATQHLAEPSSIRGSKKNNKLCSKRLRRKLVQPFLEAFNERIDKRMHGLEEAVANEAWNHMSSLSLSPSTSMPTTLTTTQESSCSCGITTPSSSSSSMEEPTASEDESSVTASETSSSSSSSLRRKPTMSDYGDDVDDEDDAAAIPLAAAEIEVLPVSALQTLAERNNCCSTSTNHNSLVVQANSLRMQAT